MNDFIGMVLIYTAIALFFLSTSAVVAFVAKEKGRSPVGFFILSLLLSFFVAILTLIALPVRTTNNMLNPNDDLISEPQKRSEISKPEPPTLQSLSMKLGKKFWFVVSAILAIALLGTLIFGVLNSQKAASASAKDDRLVAAVDKCGAQTDYRIQGKSIELASTMPIEMKQCILSQFSYEAALEIGKIQGAIGTQKDQEFSKEFTDGFLVIQGNWKFDDPYGSGTWSISN